MNRYEWTPASEPPDSKRMVIVWVCYGRQKYFCAGMYMKHSAKWISNGIWFEAPWQVTHWRDVEPPTENGK